MRQSARPEALHHVERLITVVTDHQAAEQRALGHRHPRRPALDHAANTIRSSRHGATAVDIGRPVELEHPDDVLRGDPPRPIIRQRSPSSAHRDPFTGAPVGDPTLLSPAPAPHLEPLTVDGDDEPRAGPDRLRVVDQEEPAVVRTQPVGRQAVPGVIGSDRRRWSRAPPRASPSTTTATAGRRSLRPPDRPRAPARPRPTTPPTPSRRRCRPRRCRAPRRPDGLVHRRSFRAARRLERQDACAPPCRRRTMSPLWIRMPPRCHRVRRDRRPIRRPAAVS